MERFELRFESVDALRACYESDLKNKRAFVPGASGYPVRVRQLARKLVRG